MERVTELFLLIGVIGFVVLERIRDRLPREVHRVLWITTVLAIGIVILLTLWTRSVHHS